ncbi:MAG: hypothetical protein ACREB8_11220 [Pseudolabrys sp.]
MFKAIAPDRRDDAGLGKVVTDRASFFCRLTLGWFTLNSGHGRRIHESVWLPVDEFAP